MQDSNNTLKERLMMSIFREPDFYHTNKNNTIINFHHCDNLDFMSTIPDNYYDLGIIDPPYGININPNIGIKKNGKPRPKINWDKNPPSPEFFKELFRVTKNQIIFGGQYFELPPTKHLIVWDKVSYDNLSFSDFEAAWTSYSQSNKIIRVKRVKEHRVHPTQKPINLYRKILKDYADSGFKILDTNGGSMSAALAAETEGLDLDIVERDTRHFDEGLNRFKKEIKQYKFTF